jgi:hypothetical protein
MEPDLARAEDVHAWLKKAVLDLRAPRHLMSAGEAGLRADVVFHAQQAAEKALKAFLAWHDVPCTISGNSGARAPSWTARLKRSSVRLLC